LNIWSLCNDYNAYPWFGEARDHVEFRYSALVNRFKKTFDYVTPHKENSETFSYEYASILRDTGSVFDSTLRRIIRKTDLDYDERIGGMMKFLRSYEPQLQYIRLRFLHYGGFVYPFKVGENGVPSWWNAYNELKHEEIVHNSQGNFKNAIVGLSALGIIKQSMGRSLDLDIFSVVGYPFAKPQERYAPEFFEYIQFNVEDDESTM